MSNPITQMREAFLEAFEDLELTASPEDVTRMWKTTIDVGAEWQATTAQKHLAALEAVRTYMERFL